jgi:hypothetical protein
MGGPHLFSNFSAMRNFGKSEPLARGLLFLCVARGQRRADLVLFVAKQQALYLAKPGCVTCVARFLQGAVRQQVF